MNKLNGKMMNKLTIILITLLPNCILIGQDQMPEWENPAIISINTEEPHASFYHARRLTQYFNIL